MGYGRAGFPLLRQEFFTPCNRLKELLCMSSYHLQQTVAITKSEPDPYSEKRHIERFFGCVFLFFRLQRPPLSGWSEMASQVALTYAASVIVGLAAQQAGRPDLIRSPKRVLAHLWEEDSQL